MKRIELNFDPAEVRREIAHEDWDRGRRAVGLGSVFDLCPSGKYYTMFANSNVAGCPVCGETGEGAHGLKRRVARKWKNESRRRRRLWVKRYSGGVHMWPPEIQRASAALNRKEIRLQAQCSRCGGCGSAEAHDDARWREAAEAALARVGLSLVESDGDPTYLLAEEYREAPDDDDGRRGLDSGPEGDDDVD